MPARPKELQPYRVAMYVLYGAVALVVSVLIFRSVVTDLFGRRSAGAAEQPATAAACLDDAERLSASLSARAALPAPHGLASEGLALEWDRFSRRWEDELATATRRCNLGPQDAAAAAHLTAAFESLEDLRRELARSGLEAAAGSHRVKEELAAARAALRH